MSLVARINDLAARVAEEIKGVFTSVSEITQRVEDLEQAEPEPLRTVNGQSVRGTGNIPTALSFTTDQAALDYSVANPGVAAFSTQAS